MSSEKRRVPRVAPGRWPKWRCHRRGGTTPRSSRVNQATLSSTSTAYWTGLRAGTSSGPDGSLTFTLSRRVTAFQGAQGGRVAESSWTRLARRRRCSRSGTPPRPGALRAQSVLAAQIPRRAGRAAPRRAPSVRLCGGDHLGSEAADVGQPHPTQQRLHIIGNAAAGRDPDPPRHDRRCAVVIAGVVWTHARTLSVPQDRKKSIILG